jgi:serine protease Do
MNKKQLAIIVLIAFFVGALGSIVIIRFTIPYLATFKNLSFLNKLSSSSPIVINRTQQVQLNEGVNLIDLIKQTGNLTVSIYSKTDPQFLGNGVLITSDGVIFTVNSVVNGQTEVTVVLTDGTSYTGLVRAADPKGELMIVTIPAKNLPVAQFQEGSALEVGQRLLTVGASRTPYAHKFATGFVIQTLANATSANQVFLSEKLDETIDTDMQASADLSGSPVATLNGRVVGLVGSKGQVILSEDMQTALSSYLSLGKITRPGLGITYSNISKSSAGIRGLEETAGVLVVSVDKNSPAQLAGILPNDYIVQVDGQDLDNRNFQQVLNRHAIGQMTLTVIRNKIRTELVVNLIQK